MVNGLDIDKMLKEHPEMLQNAEASQELCSKNIGVPKKLRKWSRGHQFIVRAGGHRYVATAIQVHNMTYHLIGP